MNDFRIIVIDWTRRDRPSPPRRRAILTTTNGSGIYADGDGATTEEAVQDLVKNTERTANAELVRSLIAGGAEVKP